MFLRAYRHDDKRHLQQLFYDTVHSVNARDYSPEQLEAWAPSEPDRDAWAELSRHYCFVVEFQKAPVGFITMTDEGVIGFLYVHKDFQGRGIASALYKQAERLAKKKGLTRLVTDVSITARAFFEKNGFVVTVEQRKALRGREFLNFRMEKKLPRGEN